MRTKTILKAIHSVAETFLLFLDNSSPRTLIVLNSIHFFFLFYFSLNSIRFSFFFIRLLKSR